MKKRILGFGLGLLALTWLVMSTVWADNASNVSANASAVQVNASSAAPAATSPAGEVKKKRRWGQ